MDLENGSLDDLWMREAFGLAKLYAILNLSLTFIASLSSFGIHKIFAFFIFSLCGLLVLFWIIFFFCWTCILEGTCYHWIFADLWFDSLYLWHPTCFYWPWYECMRINGMESLCMKLWMVNMGMSSMMCAFFDLY